MRAHLLSLVLIGLTCGLSLRAEEAPPPEPPAQDPGTAIPGSISDGTPPVPAPPHESLEVVVRNTLSEKINVEMASELPGVLAARREVTATVQMVDDPGFPDPPPPLPLLPREDAAVQGRMAEFREEHPDTRLLIVTGEVVDRTYTRFTVYPDGKADGAAVCFSNLDFENFGGFSSFRAKGPDGVVREYGLILSIGTTDQGAEPPALPTLASGGPAYVIDAGSHPGPDALQAVEDLHALFRVEGGRMMAARVAREAAQVERKALLQENPPQPGDVTIRFWKRAEPVATSPQPPQIQQPQQEGDP